MNSKPELHIAPCSHEAATFAVRHWHYSTGMPSGRLFRLGVWESGRFCGAVIFGRGTTRHIGKFAGLSQTECCELVRVALGRHATPTSRVLAVSLRVLRKHCPGLRAVVSYADTEQGHVGTIYQATGWLYLGPVSMKYVRIGGRVEYLRTVSSRYPTASIEWLREHVDPQAEYVQKPPKHKYLFLFDRSLAGRLQPRPYPKDRGRSETGDTRGAPAAKEGFDSHSAALTGPDG